MASEVETVLIQRDPETDVVTISTRPDLTWSEILNVMSDAYLLTLTARNREECGEFHGRN